MLSDGMASGSPALRYREGPANGRPLVLLHGLARAWQDYEALIPVLLPRWHVFAIDHRGHGQSARTPGRYLVTDYAGDVARFVTEQLRERAILYGHSLGAMVALAVAAQSPGAIAGIILEDPPFHTMGRRIATTPWHALFIAAQAVARGGGDIETMAAGLAAIRLPAPSGDGLTTLGQLRSAESVRLSARCLGWVDPEVYTPVIEGRWLEGYDERALAPRVRCPVLLLQGDPGAGGALTDADAAGVENALKRCDRVRFTGVGHMIRAERFDAIVKRIGDYGSLTAR